MSAQQKEKAGKVINLDEQRKNRRWIGNKKNKDKKNAASKENSSPKIWVWIQFIAFMAVFAYFMSKCKG